MNATVHPQIPALPAIRIAPPQVFVDGLSAAWRTWRRSADQRATQRVLATLSAETLRDIGLTHLTPAPSPRELAIDLRVGFW